LTISLKLVTKNDLQFLYDLLKERDKKVNISHKKMPSYKNHVKFVMSKPYQKWYIIMNDKEKIGSIYLSKFDEIGIFIKKDWRGSKIGHKALELIIEKNPRKRYLANINPQNLKSIKFFNDNNFKLIQYTYEMLK